MLAGWSTQCQCGQPLIWLSQNYASELIKAFMEIAGGFEAADVHLIKIDGDRWEYCSKCSRKIWPPYQAAPIILRIDDQTPELRFGDRDAVPAHFGPTGSTSGLDFQAPALA